MQKNILLLGSTLLFATLLSGCWPPDLCVAGRLQADSKYQVTFEELYNEDSSLARWVPTTVGGANEGCALQMAPQTSFVATALFEEQLNDPNGCDTWILEVDDLVGAEDVVHDLLTGSGSLGDHDPFAVWSGRVDYSGCQAQWTVELLAPNGQNVFEPASPSSEPPLLISRALTVAAGDGCGDTAYACTDVWIGSMEQLR